MNITPLPVWIRLVYWNDPHATPEDCLYEFTDNEFEAMDMGAHDYWFAVEYYEDIWDEVPEKYSAREQEST